jgi:hypothetical protein
MKQITRVARLTLGCLTANLLLVIAGASAKDCGLKLLGSADFSIDRGQLVLVQVTVNDRPATMMLDVSSFVTMVWSNYLQPFGIRALTAQRQLQVQRAGESTPMRQFAKLPSLTVGSLKLGDKPVWVAPDADPPSTVDSPTIGQLGMDVIVGADAVPGMGALAGKDFELDFAHRKLNFYSPDHCRGGGVVYWTPHYSSTPLTRAPMGNYLFPIKLEGKWVEAVMSTTSGQTRILSDATRQLYGFDEKSADIEADLASSAPTYYRKLSLAALGSGGNARIGLDTRAVDSSCQLTSRGTGAAYYLGQACRGQEAPLELGLDVLSRLHLYFAAKEQTLYYSDAAAAN